MFNAFVRLAVGVTQRDTQCGLKAFRRAALERLAPALTVDGFALDVEMLLVAKALALRVAEIPVNVHYETSKSSVRLIGSGRAMIRDILGIALRRLRGAYSPTRLRALAATSASTSLR
jgi:dolichyl-phosphate beta-glucosyltransferase